jgi:hypothetical protein
MHRMETRVGPQTPYEVYCYECRVTFPLGTRNCVHCGRPIGAPPGARVPNPLIPTGDAVEAPDPLSTARRVGGLSLWVLLALGAALSRLCAGG